MSKLPLLARFRDPNRPLEAQRVDPAHLDQLFGEGVILQRSRIHITDEPVSWSIYERWPWLRTFDGSIAHVNKIPAEYEDILNQITDGYFGMGNPERVKHVRDKLKLLENASKRMGQ